MKVYLAGLISTEKPESLQWRLDAAPSLEADGWEVLSPMRGKEKLGSITKDGGLTTTVNTSRDIILRDRRDVIESDVILANLEDFGSTRPMVGTIYELAWAWDLRKPVVAVAKEDNYLMRNHPFVKETIAHFCPTVEEAVDYINGYYARN